MPNGRGTADCHTCEHHYFDPEARPDGTHYAYCRYYAIKLPRGLDPEDRKLHPHIGSLNLFCTRHESATPKDPSLPEPLRATCQDDVLYAIFYNDMGAYLYTAPTDPPDSLVRLLQLPHDRRPDARKA